ncbi:GGDEF domain-containing protein [Undibacterium sp. CY18W]|uniref:diguanylate cyclase n=1 Tax=Undibacterium hunanense TaxID=2762292 RepID=A0ABR6ZV56_9BURK|nr:GGDEF domain-containing protein [Undibacterium hunanense]MBC3919753.1 GGDEF domain-containing protein [Undibacterium hunanense]
MRHMRLVVVFLLFISDFAQGASSLRERADQCLILASDNGAAAQGIIASLKAERDLAGDVGASAMVRLCEMGFHDDSASYELIETQYTLFLEQSLQQNDLNLQASVLFVRGNRRTYFGLYPDALNDLNTAFSIFEKTGNKAYNIMVMNSLALTYSDKHVGDYENALLILNKLLAIARDSKDLGRESTTEFNIGILYNNQNKSELALPHFRRAREIDVQRKAPADEVSFDERSIGMALSKMGRHVEALAQLDHAIKLEATATGEERAALLLQARGAALRRAGKNSEALHDLDRALAYFQKTGNLRFLLTIHEDRALAFLGQNQIQAAYEERVSQLEAKNKLDQQALDQQTGLLRVRFQTEQQQQQNRKLAKQNESQQAELKNAHEIKKLQLLALGLSMLVVFSLIIIVVVMMRSSQRLRILAFTDALTGLKNRRRFMWKAREAQKRSVNDGLYFLMVDIDDFKKINDSRGHDVGDEVLKSTASIIARVSEGNLCGRLGGEEFGIVFQGDRDKLQEFATELVNGVRKAFMPPTTISVGVAKFESDTDLSDVFKRADLALYLAKSGGKDRYVIDSDRAYEDSASIMTNF